MWWLVAMILTGLFREAATNFIYKRYVMRLLRVTTPNPDHWRPLPVDLAITLSPSLGAGSWLHTHIMKQIINAIDSQSDPPPQASSLRCSTWGKRLLIRELFRQLASGLDSCCLKAKKPISSLFIPDCISSRR